MRPERPDAGSAEDWLRHARSDLALARRRPSDDILWETLAFHCQQCVEKALKALLVAVGREVPKTHSIGELLDLVSLHHSPPDSVMQSAYLTDYAVLMRYPGEYEPVTADEHAKALHSAEVALAWAERTVRGGSTDAGARE